KVRTPMNRLAREDRISDGPRFFGQTTRHMTPPPSATRSKPTQDADEAEGGLRSSATPPDAMTRTNRPATCRCRIRISLEVIRPARRSVAIHARRGYKKTR